MFYRRFYGESRDRLNSFIFRHAPAELRRAILRLGAERNRPSWMLKRD